MTPGLTFSGPGIMQKILWVSLFAFIAFFIKSDSVFASVLVSYTSSYADSLNSSASAWSDSYPDSRLSIGSGWSGSVYSLMVYARCTSCTSVSNLKLVLIGHTDPRYTSSSQSTYNSFERLYLTSTSTFVTATTSSYFTLNPSLYYTIRFVDDSTGNVDVFGSASSTQNYTHGTSSMPTGFVPYFILNTVPDFTDATTRIVSVSSPTNGGITSTTLVDFAYTYFIGSDVFNYAGLEVRDTTVGQTINTGGEESSILASGYSAYSSRVSLSSGHSYLWRPYLRSTDGSYLYGNWRTFYVVSNNTMSTTTDPTNIQQPYVPASTTPVTIGSTTSTTSLSIYDSTDWCNTAVAFNIIATKFPFSYICDFSLVVRELGGQEATTRDIVVHMPANIASSTPSLVLLDASVVGEYEVVKSVRTLIKYALWLMFAMYMLFAISRVLTRY